MFLRAQVMTLKYAADTMSAEVGSFPPTEGRWLLAAVATVFVVGQRCMVVCYQPGLLLSACVR